MNGSNRFVVTVTDGQSYTCILFNKETAAKLNKACRAFAFDSRVHYRKYLDKFRGRIMRIYDESPSNEGLKKLCVFLSQTQLNSYFAVSGGDITGSPLFLQVLANLAIRNDREYPVEWEDKFRVLSNYRYMSLGTVVRKAGTILRSRRKCRYCGEGIPATTFFSKAHTVSEALGNKTLYTNDECDRCNFAFARKIEAQFINRLSPSFPVLDIAGKSGGRKVKGKYYSLYRDKNNEQRKEITLNMSDMAISRHGGANLSDIEMRAVSPARSWAPQNIYRLLCKFVIGTLDTRLLRYFRDTIEWINGKNFMIQLPHVCVEHLGHTVNQPLVYIYRRRQNKNLDPYMFARVHILTCAYTFIIPFCSLDVEGPNRDEFLKNVSGLIPSVRCQWLDLSSRKLIVPEIMAYFVTGDHHITWEPDTEPYSRWYPVL